MDTRIRILMVDDVTRYQSVYEMAITDALPATVDFATNGQEALSALESPQPYDLLILDLNMPKLGGEETLKRLRQDPNFDNMPVIILTGDPQPETHRRLLEIGADDFVEKGAPPELFVARLKAQMRHKLALDRLTQMAVDMDIFAAGVLHDIRNLETNVITVCDLTRYYLDADPQEHRDQILEDLRSLEDKADHLEDYATQIIRMVRDTRRDFTLAPEDMDTTIEWVMRVAGAPATQGGSAGELTWERITPLEPVVADPHFLRLALLNVVQNSLKYARTGVPPHIEVSQEEKTGENLRIEGPTRVTRLRDNGRGIEPEHLRRVFEPFVRGVGGEKKDTGFGLGLSLVTKVITKMKGRVWAEAPESGQGLVVCIELPAAPSPSADREKAEDRS